MPEEPDEEKDGEKKKKKRRKNKKKKKKKPEEAPKAPEAEAEGVEADDGSTECVDPEFEEDLKQFSLRLQSQQSSMLSGARSGGRFRKLRPNISSDWLYSIKQLCKSNSTPTPLLPQDLTPSSEAGLTLM